MEGLLCSIYGGSIESRGVHLLDLGESIEDRYGDLPVEFQIANTEHEHTEQQCTLAIVLAPMNREVKGGQSHSPPPPPPPPPPQQ
jgi:hypothetical protein